MPRYVMPIVAPSSAWKTMRQSSRITPTRTRRPADGPVTTFYTYLQVTPATFTDQHRAAQARVRGRIWSFYASLKAYQLKPSERRSIALRARFDRIFLRRTGFVTLDRLLARLHANKDELLMVLDRPEISLHTNGSENDIRCYVTRRKVSAGTRSDIGRDCRDAFLSLAKTCDKLGIAVWDYLGSRFKVAGHARIEPLDHYVRARIRPA